MSVTANPPTPTTERTVAILSDVHANLPALEAVLDDAQQAGVEAVWHLGDCIGYGPFVNDVLDRLFAACQAQVIGNYDQRVLAFPDKQDKWKTSKHPEKFRAFEWAFETLTPANAARLKAMPRQQRQTVGPLEILLTHGGPAAMDEAIGPDTPPARLEQLADLTDADVILCGHTHRPFYRTVNGVTFLNPGSVGRPEGGDPRAAYAILTVGATGLTVAIRRVAYDIERMTRAIHAAGLPANFATMFRTGQNLQTVQAAQADVPLPETAERLAAVRRFAQRCRCERDHVEQVTRLTRQLFQQLAGLHKLGREPLFLLTCAAILHDIGWVQGGAGHHKASMALILQDTTLPLSDAQRRIVALTARYHRRALPKKSHPVYGSLPRQDRATVRLLAGLLRVADGLDHSHQSLVTDVTAAVSPGRIDVRCRTTGPALPEMLAAQKKADLLEKTLAVKLRLTSE